MMFMLSILGGVVVGLVLGVAIVAVLIKFVFRPLLDWALE